MYSTVIDSSGSNNHDLCNSESSNTDNVFLTDIMEENTAPYDSTESEDGDDGSGQLIFDTMAGGWAYVSLTQETAQVALDAVRHQSNYNKTITSRLCLHYINTIRKRMRGGLTIYLFNVDGCASSQIEATGRCDVYDCRPYTYELQIAEKERNSDEFMVQSIYKTVDQKTLDKYRDEVSNLDWSIALDTDAGSRNESVFKATESPVASEQPVWRGVVEAFLEGSTLLDGEEEEPIAWTNNVNTLWQPTQQVTNKPLSLRVETMSSTELQPEVVGSDNPGAATVAIIGIVAVAVSTIAFVFALVVARWRTKVKRTHRASTREYVTLRGTLNTAENSISITSRDSVSGDTKKSDLEKVEFFS